MTPEPHAIVYGIIELNGIPVRPSSRDILKKAIKGQPIEITASNDYINLYHVFSRMQERDRKLRSLVLVRKQVADSLWRLFVVKDRKDAPEVEIHEGYNPKRGRYKRYAQQLATGDALTFSSQREAIKARRAWQLYVPRAKRKHLGSTVRRVGATERYVVSIQAKN